ncbi:MAG: CPP1-like family protein [Cyanobium sp.]
MNQGTDPSPESHPAGAAGSDPYVHLGVAVDASFDEVQAARDVRLQEAGDDPIARARIEAAYDAILMNRLRERQQGRVSSAARTASQREQTISSAAARPSSAPVPRLPQLPLAGARLPGLPRFGKLSLSLASGRERWFPLASIGSLLLVLLLLPGSPAELLLALATLATMLNLLRRNGRFLPALGWSFGLLSLGLVLGQLLAGALNPSLPLGLPISLIQVQSVPALLLLLLGALLIA